MDPDFSNYLSNQKSFLAISGVSSLHPLGLQQSQVGDHESDSDFYDMYNYSTNVLKSWGLQLGFMRPSGENTKTVNCLMQLIRIRHKDLEYKQKVKQENVKAEYDKSVAKTNLARATDQVTQYKRKLGQLENKFRQQELRFRKDSKSLAAQKQQLAQITKKLQQKNTQTLHELKKKETEFNRIRDSMKRPSDKTQPRNSFEVIAAVSNSDAEEPSKYIVLKDKFQAERRHYFKENTTMRQQLQSVQEMINDLIRFLKENCQSKALQELKMAPQHHMDYNEGKLLERLSSTIDDIKTNLTDIMDQPSKIRPSIPLMSKFTKRSSLEHPPKMTQSVAVKMPPKEQLDYSCEGMPNDDISIISHVSIKDIEMPLKGKANYDKWDILYDGRL